MEGVISSEAVWRSIREWALNQERDIWKVIEELEKVAQEELDEEVRLSLSQIGDRLEVELEALNAITAATPEVVAKLGEKDFGDIERLLMDQARMLGRSYAYIGIVYFSLGYIPFYDGVSWGY